VTPAKRSLAVAAGLTLLLALTACGGSRGGYGNANGAAPTTPAPAPAEEDAEDAEPVGITTDRLVARSIPRMGRVVTDAEGYLLYRFDADSQDTSECVGKCAAVWPPVIAEGTPTLKGIARSKVGTIKRADGSTQLTLGGRPLYRYIGDPKPGAWKGQMVNGTWFVIAPNGRKNLSCLPSETPEAVAPPEEGEAAAAPEEEEEAPAPEPETDEEPESDGYEYEY
jgi:predicted lipoprotein with Yx(FWY)xxD motif